jgi:hypothetical protein
MPDSTALVRRSMVRMGSAVSPKAHSTQNRMRLDHPDDHPDDPSGSVGSRLDRRGTQREQARSVCCRPVRREALTRNRKVVGSNPTSGSKTAGQRASLGEMTAQRQQAVIPLGSNIAPQARPAPASLRRNPSGGLSARRWASFVGPLRAKSRKTDDWAALRAGRAIARIRKTSLRLHALSHSTRADCRNEYRASRSVSRQGAPDLAIGRPAPPARYPDYGSYLRENVPGLWMSWPSMFMYTL